MDSKINIFKKINSKLQEIDKSSLSFHNSVIFEDLKNLTDEFVYWDVVEKKNYIHHKTKILVIDDDEDISKLIHYSLGDQHFDIKTLNPLDALTRLTDTNEDYIILVDFIMLEMTGLEFLNQLKKIAKHQLFKIIMMSEQHSDVDKRISLEAGANEFMQKPLDVHYLKNIINKDL